MSGTLTTRRGVGVANRTVPALAGAGLAAAAAAVVLTLPPAQVVLLAAAGVWAACLSNVRVAIGVSLAVLVGVEIVAAPGVPPSVPIYDGIGPQGVLKPVDLMVGSLLLVTVLGPNGSEARGRSATRALMNVTVLLWLLVPAIFVGTVAGIADPRFSATAAVPMLRPIVFLVVYAWLIPACFKADQLRPLAAAVAAAFAVKCVVGITFWVSGAGYTEHGQRLTYYEAPMNWLAVVVIVAALAVALHRPSMTRRDRLSLDLLAALAALDLLLSFRRSFWLAAVVAIAVLVAMTLIERERSTSRRRLVAALAVVTGLMIIATQVAAFGPFAEPARDVESRATSLNRLDATADDRYRSQELRNVVALVRERPLTGIGIGVPWTARYPLAHEVEGARYYTHSGISSFALKAGVFGVVAYVGLLVVTLLLSLRLWRGDVGARNVVGIVATSVVLSTAAVELTASFVGVDVRMSSLWGVLLGVLFVLSPRPERLPSPRST